MSPIRGGTVAAAGGPDDRASVAAAGGPDENVAPAPLPRIREPPLLQGGDGHSLQGRGRSPPPAAEPCVPLGAGAGGGGGGAAARAHERADEVLKRERYATRGRFNELKANPQLMRGYKSYLE